MTYPLKPEDIAAIEAEAKRIGFDAVGLAPAQIGQREKDRFHQFIENEEYGTMDWMAKNTDRRESPTGLWSDVKTIIILGTNYGPDHDPMDNLDDPDFANISIYARHKDYHDLVKKRLKQLARWLVEHYDNELKVFVDTAPVLEKPLAAQSRIGWQGKHSNLVSREFGSWLFLGEIYVTLSLPPDQPQGDHCGACQSCIDICPTQAIVAPYKIDPRRCISYLSIEEKGHIPEEFRKIMGNRIYGCDDCLAICPWNKFAQPTTHETLKARADISQAKLVDYLHLDDQAFRDFFRASPVKRLGRDKFLRNVLIGLGNSGNQQACEKILPLCQDQSDLVRAMAVWALRQLLSNDEFEAIKRDHRDDEPDEIVRFEWNQTADHH